MATKTRTKLPSAQKNVQAPGTTRGFDLNEDMFGEITSTKDVVFIKRRMSAKYLPLVQRVLSLKRNQSFDLAVPASSNMANFRATVSSTLRKRTEGNLPAGTRLAFGINQANRLVISLVADED